MCPFNILVGVMCGRLVSVGVSDLWQLLAVGCGRFVAVSCFSTGLILIFSPDNRGGESPPSLA